MTDNPIDLFEDDARVERRLAKNINGHTYSYIYAVPENGTYHSTIFLIHGWPDLSAGWRFQIPMMLDLGLRVVAPDLIGFGGTDAPTVPPAQLSAYSHKQVSKDIADLASRLNAPTIILGGHDWGGALVYRTARYYPNLVSYVISICTPFGRPHSLSETIQKAPNFGYQKHLGGPDVESTVNNEVKIRQFLNGIYGGHLPNKEIFLIPEKGVRLDLLGQIADTRLMTKKEMDYYVHEYARHGLHGTLNWYRTHDINASDEQNLPRHINQPTLFIAGLKDSVLLPSMAAGMQRDIPHLTCREVNTSHWAMIQDPQGVNAHLKEWLEEVVFGKGVSRL